MELPDLPFGISWMSVGLSVYFGVIGLVIYLMFLSDPDTSGVNRFFTQTFPERLMYEVEYYLGSKTKGRVTRVWDYVVNERNPIMQVMYLIIVLGAFGTMIVRGYPHLDQSNVVMAPYHKYIGYVAMSSCIFMFYVCCTSNPGYIRERNLAVFDVFPYDNVLFSSSSICKTKKIRKLARSKFDRMTNEHVAKFDHFCSWLNNPVGELNYRYFITFLALHAFTLLYGAFACGTIFYSLVVNQRLMQQKFYQPSLGIVSGPTPWILFNYIATEHMPLVGLFLLAGVMGLVVLLFLCFHLTLIWLNMTTNEFFKWRDLCNWHRAQQRKYAAAKAGNKVGKGPPLIAGKAFTAENNIDYKVRLGGFGGNGGILWWLVGGGAFGGGKLMGGVSASQQPGDEEKKKDERGKKAAVMDRDVGCIGVGAVAASVAKGSETGGGEEDDEYDKCDDVVLDAESEKKKKEKEIEPQQSSSGEEGKSKKGDKKKHAAKDEKRDGERKEEEEEEEQKHDPNAPIVVDDIGPMPINIYNRGFRENLIEVFWPRTLGKDGASDLVWNYDRETQGTVAGKNPLSADSGSKGKKGSSKKVN